MPTGFFFTETRLGFFELESGFTVYWIITDFSFPRDCIGKINQNILENILSLRDFKRDFKNKFSIKTPLGVIYL